VSELRILPILSGFFVAVLVLTPALSTKFILLGPLVVPGATLLFPFAFVINDVLTEVYGWARSRRVIWTGLACQLLAALSFWVVGALPAPAFWPHAESYRVILGLAPRIALASLLAYLAGEFANSIVLSRMKFAHGGQTGLRQSWRFLASTLVGQAVDSTVFMLVAFGGALPAGELATGIVTIYGVKVAVETLVLPASQRFANWLKRVEHCDQLDDPATVSYNPFRLRLARSA